jgi:hypothetical protein
MFADTFMLCSSFKFGHTTMADVRLLSITNLPVRMNCLLLRLAYQFVTLIVKANKS